MPGTQGDPCGRLYNGELGPGPPGGLTSGPVPVPAVEPGPERCADTGSAIASAATIATLLKRYFMGLIPPATRKPRYGLRPIRSRDANQMSELFPFKAHGLFNKGLMHQRGQAPCLSHERDQPAPCVAGLSMLMVWWSCPVELV